MVSMVIIIGTLMMGMTGAAIAAVNYYDNILMKY